jgi:serine/threonine protein kinase
VCCQVGFRICSAIHGLHQAGIVHGDIKPRNIVRDGVNFWKLIDLDMAFRWRCVSCPIHYTLRPNVPSLALLSRRCNIVTLLCSQVGSLDGAGQPRQVSAESVSSQDLPGFIDKRFALAPRDKCLASTAYQCPEIIAYARASDEDEHGALQVAENQLATPLRIDIWSFAVTLYEIATGLSLFEHQCVTAARPTRRPCLHVVSDAPKCTALTQCDAAFRYDRATEESEDKLMTWTGLSHAHIKTIEAM